jgi:long-chain fatty acid transport protein
MKTSFLGISTAAALGTFVTLLASDASAAGTALDVQSARGTGMASATTAIIDDSSAIFYNPAGMAQGKGLDAQVGITLIAPAFAYQGATGDKVTMPFSVVTPFQAYVAGGITDDLSIGVGVFTPYGLTLKWPDGWVGRHQITEASLRTFYINPTAAYKIGPFRIGAGFQLVRATVELQKDVAFGDQDGHADLGGGTWGAGGNVGIQLEAIKQYLSFGAHYRSAVKLAFDDGNVHFSNVPRGLAGTIHDQAVKTSVVQPDSLAFGVATHPLPKLAIDVDVVYYGWSRFKSIDINYPNDPTGSLNSSQPKNWSDTLNVHVGAEGALNDTWMLRGGVLIDPTPSPANTLTPDIPDATRINLAIGASWKHESGVKVDLGYQFIIVTTKSSTAPQFKGDYSGLVNILGISVGFGTPKAKEPSNAPPPDLTPSTDAPTGGTPAGAPPTSAPPEPAPAPTPAPAPGM